MFHQYMYNVLETDDIYIYNLDLGLKLEDQHTNYNFNL